MTCTFEPGRATEKAMEKNMGGCVAGFFHIFDRHHLMSPKRLHNSPASSPPAKVYSATPTQEEDTITVIKALPPLHFPATFEDQVLLRSPWKLRDSPRLSLDSRVNAKLRSGAPADPARHSEVQRGPGVVGRLMGLDALPTTPEKKAELRRSSSESRVSGQRLAAFDGVYCAHTAAPSPAQRTQPVTVKAKKIKPATLRSHQPARSFFDVFPPEPAKKAIGIPVEIEKKLKARWIDDQSADLEALKQIVEALHLKGLLRTVPSPAPDKKRNLVHDSRSPVRSPKTPPAKSPRTPPARSPKTPPARRPFPPPVPKCKRLEKSSRNTPLTNPNQKTPPARLLPPVTDEDSTTMSSASDGSGSIQSVLDVDAGERGLIAEYYKQGKNLFHRCDKLLNSIAEITGNDQPSPVSVLDAGASFYRDEEDCSPPPLPMKKCRLFHGIAANDKFSPETERFAGDSDFFYVGEVLRAKEISGHRSSPDVFASLEKRLHAGGSDTARLHRRVLFDAVVEIAGASNRRGRPEVATVKKVWAEIERLRRRTAPAGDVGVVVGGVLGKDMAATGGEWGGAGEETANLALDVERLIFKDLVGEAIRELAGAGQIRPVSTVFKRRLAF